MTPLHEAAAKCDRKQSPGLVAAFLEHANVEVNVVNKSGRTPLHIAANREDDHGAAGALVRHRDIDLEVKNDGGLTALQMAASNGYFRAVKEILEAPPLLALAIALMR